MLVRHTYKIAVGVPIALLLASTLSFVRTDEAIGLVCKDTRYVEAGSYFAVDVMAESTQPVNVVSGTISFESGIVSFVESGTDDSIVDLWTDEISTTSQGTLTFSGGMVKQGGFTGKGSVARMTFKAERQGTARFTFSDAHLLAHDGEGTDILEGTRPLTIIVRPQGMPTPDVNQDARVNLIDVGIVSSRLFGSYEATYDLNRDGKITLADLSIIFAQFVNGSRLGSLVLALGV